MAFDEIRLPAYYAAQTNGGPNFDVSKSGTVSGDSVSVLHGEAGLWSWEIDFTTLTEAQLDELIVFYNGRRGNKYRFRFLDTQRYAASQMPLVRIGVTNTAQMYYRENDPIRPLDKKVRKPINPSTYPNTEGLITHPAIVVRRNGSTVSPSSIDYNTGIVTLSDATGTLDWSGHFHFCVEFDTDGMKKSANNDNLRQWMAVGLKETLTD